jgi:hypothetical protein
MSEPLACLPQHNLGEPVIIAKFLNHGNTLHCMWLAVQEVLSGAPCLWINA